MRVGRSEIFITGIGAYRAIDKLARENIAVLSAKAVQKKGVRLQVYRKDYQKAFAILQSSCYNVENTRPRGLARAIAACVKYAGLLAGAAIFLLSVGLVQTRVLRVEVKGSGAYLAREVREILSGSGVKFFSTAPKELAPLRAEILSLPRVSFCSIGKSGGVLTVTVEVSDENATLSSKPLLAPAGGVVEELIVVRGTALVAVGDEVKEGDPVVKNTALLGETEREVIVIARVTVSYPFAREYSLSEEGARAQAQLDFGEDAEIHTTKSGENWLVTGVAYARAAVNLG